jgi:hypothetical protein
MSANWTPFQRAYVDAVNGMQALIEPWVAKTITDPTFNIVGATRGLDWGPFQRMLLEGWEKSARPAIHSVVAATLKAEGSRLSLTKQAPDPGNTPPTGLSTVDLAEQFTLEWMQNRGLSMAVDLTKKSRAAGEKILDEGIQRGWTVQTIAKKLRTVIGLTNRDAEALKNFEERQIKQGRSGTQVGIRTADYRKTLIRRRAKAIAITETTAALNMGRLNAWRVMQHEGEISTAAKKEWVGGDCGICQEFANGGPVPINGMFVGKGHTASAPPAHTNCGCHLRLVRTKKP